MKVCTSNKLAGSNVLVRERTISGMTNQRQVLRGKIDKVLDRPTPNSKY